MRGGANDPSGHRKRLRQRLLDGGMDSLADHEVIELLLMQAVPRRDMKPLARSLIQRFGSLAGVLQADPRTLAMHPEMGEATAAALRIVTVAATRLARQKVREAPVIGSWQALIDYLTMLSWSALCGIVEVGGSLKRFRSSDHPSPELPPQLLD